MMTTSSATPDSSDRLPPAWARRYQPGDFPPYGYTADVIALRVAGEDGDELQGLTVVRGEEGPYVGMRAWPGGFVDWSRDEDARAAALRELAEETGLGAPVHLETLDTYDTNGRDPRQFAGELAGEGRGVRVVSKAHLALFGDRGPRPRARPGEDAARADWQGAYRYLPWEDHRTRRGVEQARDLERALDDWADEAPTPAERRQRRGRIRHAWGAGTEAWNEERAGERFRLLHEAALVEESVRDRWGQLSEDVDRDTFAGEVLAFDHRQMLADALGRLRGKIKYLPAALGALAGDTFIFAELQRVVEAVAGRKLTGSNFRRAVAYSSDYRIVEGTGETRSTQAPGPNPEVFRFVHDALHVRLDPSIRMPWAGPTES